MGRVAIILAIGIAVVVASPSGFAQIPPAPTVLQRAHLPFQGTHLSPSDGVLRDPSVPRGDCRQCHLSHKENSPNASNLFAPNDNLLCYSTTGVLGCHLNSPEGGKSGYPAQESDRLPDQHPYHGYFESNVGGQATYGVDNRVRWPGKLVWENLTYSAHYRSADMPRLDNSGHGSCLNCHDPHDGASPYDQLIRPYGPISGAGSNAAPAEYALCLECHGPNGPGSMTIESRRIADFYSASSSGSARAGHAIDHTQGAVNNGDRLPCYDCHNPHGSVGSDGQNPNAFLISDQRPGWYGLTDIRNDSVQVRRFCTGCHAYPDQPGSGSTVEGITPEGLPDEYPHRSYETKHCYDCHGRDYSSPSGFNIHNPGEGEGGGG